MDENEGKNILKEIGLSGNNNNSSNKNSFFQNNLNQNQVNKDINITINNNNFIRHYQINNNNNFERMLNMNNYPFDYQNKI